MIASGAIATDVAKFGPGARQRLMKEIPFGKTRIRQSGGGGLCSLGCLPQHSLLRVLALAQPQFDASFEKSCEPQAG